MKELYEDKSCVAHIRKESTNDRISKNPHSQSHSAAIRRDKWKLLAPPEIQTSSHTSIRLIILTRLARATTATRSVQSSDEK